MKKVSKSMIAIILIMMSLSAVSGTNSFDKLMKKNLQTLRVKNEKVNFVEVADNFAKIAENNPNRFEPLYYSAYSYIMASWEFYDLTKKTELLSKAYDAIDKGLLLSPENAELIVLKAFYYQAMILTNPQKFGPTYSKKASELFSKVQRIEPSNPRAQFLMAQNTYYTPVEYGGGKDKALPLFKKAAGFFKSQETSNYLSPIWGEQTNNKMILECSK
ncbi:MAG: hypothetical protein C0598_07920 [Marinilabiliales bacterium]|nr:MAG: hypothetical protein C0598_07920 [Marinilabiliales bacterium]